MDVIDWARNIPVHDLSDGRGLCRVIFAEDFLNALKDLPSAQPEPQWIPCSERLPKVGQDVLFSVQDLFVSEGCLRDDGDWSQFRWQAIQKKEAVTAWMPLPEPYNPT